MQQDKAGERGVFKVRIERRGWVVQREHAECILISVPVAKLYESQEKGKGLPLLHSICKKQLPRSLSWILFRGQAEEDREGVRRREDRRREEEKVLKSRTPATYMGCVLSSDWCGEEEVQPVPVVRSSSVKRRTLERSESGRMRLTKVSVHVLYTWVCDDITDEHVYYNWACVSWVSTRGTWVYSLSPGFTSGASSD